jgi:hypothetical protein
MVDEHNYSLDFFHFILNPEQRRVFQLVLNKHVLVTYFFRECFQEHARFISAHVIAVYSHTYRYFIS